MDFAAALRETGFCSGTAGNRHAVLVGLISLGVVVLATTVLSASAVAAPGEPYSLVICALPERAACAPIRLRRSAARGGRCRRGLRISP